MSGERSFLIILANGVRMRVRFVLDRGHVTEFVVQLEALLLDAWCPVVRYDNVHGLPHLDLLDRWGRQQRKVWLRGSNNDVLTQGVNDIQQNWEQYLSRFVEDRWQ